MGVNEVFYDFPMLEIGAFFGINTDLRINPNSIPHPAIDLFKFFAVTSHYFVGHYFAVCTNDHIQNEYYLFIFMILQ